MVAALGWACIPPASPATEQAPLSLYPGAGPARIEGRDWSPSAEERQLPRKMRSAMTDVPRIAVGQTNADLLGTDNRALQAAVDYVAGLGGGIVEIGPGEYLMRDSLHLRPRVVVRGTPDRWPAFSRVFPVVVFPPDAEMMEAPPRTAGNGEASRSREVSR